jgi:hypothetical protein
MRHIAAHQRQLRGSVSTDGGGDGPLDGISGALTAATSRSGGWLSPPRRLGNWQDSLGNTTARSGGRSRSAPRLRVGKLVQADPMIPTLKALGTKRLKPK